MTGLFWSIRQLLLRRAAASALAVQETWAPGSRLPGDPAFHARMAHLVGLLENPRARPEGGCQDDPRRSDFGLTG